MAASCWLLAGHELKESFSCAHCFQTKYVSMSWQLLLFSAGNWKAFLSVYSIYLEEKLNLFFHIKKQQQSAFYRKCELNNWHVLNKLSDKISSRHDDCHTHSPKLAVIASISLGFRLRGRPFWRGCCGSPDMDPEFGPDAFRCWPCAP